MPDELEVAKAAVEAGKELVKQSYEDAARPAMKELGRSLHAAGSVLSLVFRPIATLALTGHALWDRLDENVRKRLASTPPENVIEPPTHVAGPLLLAYPFVEPEAELRRLFVELLAKSMIVDSRPLVHPAFVEILKQLSPDEARLLQSLRGASAHPMLRACFSTTPPPPPSDEQRFIEFSDIERRARPIVGATIVTSLPDKLTLERGDVDAVERALLNFARLKIVDIDEDASFEDKTRYDAVRNSASYREVENEASRRGLFVDWFEGIVHVTPFGAQFMASCLPDDCGSPVPAARPGDADAQS